MNETYLRTARLLTQVAPSVFVDDTFALKGGTAINLFYRDLPRLSVEASVESRTSAGGTAPVRVAEAIAAARARRRN